MSEIKLNPCPFCGGEAEINRVNKGVVSPQYKLYYCYCKQCGSAAGVCATEKLAAAAWNTRKPVDAVLDRLEDERLYYFLTIANTGDEKNDSIYEAVGNVIDKAIEIIKEWIKE